MIKSYYKVGAKQNPHSELKLKAITCLSYLCGFYFASVN